MRHPLLVSFILLAAQAACAASAAPAAPAATPRRAPTPAATPAPAAPPAAPAAPAQAQPAHHDHGDKPDPYHLAIHELTDALQRRQLDRARTLLERVRGLAGTGQPHIDHVAYFDATLHAYAGDFDGAAAILAGHLLAHPSKDGALEFWFHNALIMVRAASGDLTGAVIERDEMTAAGRAGTWPSPDEPRETGVALKERWHRAYLERLVAAGAPAARRPALIAYAERARAAYGALAAPVEGSADSVAVLAAVFATLDGNRAAALDAARKVSATDDDAEDLYLTQLALRFGGDATAAEAMQKRIAGLDASIAIPIMLRWIEIDASAPSVRCARWTPARALAKCP